MTTGTPGLLQPPLPPGSYRAECAILPRLMTAAFASNRISGPSLTAKLPSKEGRNAHTYLCH
jgi:hypothetical protein